MAYALAYPDKVKQQGCQIFAPGYKVVVKETHNGPVNLDCVLLQGSPDGLPEAPGGKCWWVLAHAVGTGDSDEKSELGVPSQENQNTKSAAAQQHTRETTSQLKETIERTLKEQKMAAADGGNERSAVKTVNSVADSSTKPQRAWLGVRAIQSITADIADAMDLKSTAGALVANTVPDGPAAKSGIESGDVITSFSGTPITDPRQLTSTIQRTAPGTTVNVGLIRDGRTQTVSVTLGAPPQENQNTNGSLQEKVAHGGDDRGIASLIKLAAKVNSAALHGWIGVETEAITAAIAANMGLKSTAGVLVANAVPGGPAAKSGIESGEVITSFDGTPITDPRQLASEIQKMAPGTTVNIGLISVTGKSKRSQF